MSKLILDKNYSNALICAMYESKKIIYEPQNEADYNMFNNVVKENKRKRIKKKALIYALLYDDLELISPCIEPKNEIIVATHHPKIDNFTFDDFINAMDIRDLSLKSVSKFRDLLSQEDEWYNDFKRLRNKYRKLSKNIDCCFYNAACLFMVGKIEEAFLQIPSFFKNDLSNEEAIIRFAYELQNGGLSPLSATLFIYMMWINDISFMMKLSTKNKTPFVSNQINLSQEWNKKTSEVKDMIDVYERCIVLMKEELPYVPQVNTFDDVLKMREKKELIRFKEVLNNWISLMSNNEVDLASKMQSDIIKANRDLKRYCGYKNKASTFFFYFSLFTSFIPVVPGAVWWGIEQATNMMIDYNINKNSWIGIGNP